MWCLSCTVHLSSLSFSSTDWPISLYCTWQLLLPAILSVNLSRFIILFASLSWNQSSMVPPWFLHGSSMVPPWFLHGSSMVPPWFLHGSSMVPPWFLHGSSMVPPWFLHGSMVTCSSDPRCIHNEFGESYFCSYIIVSLVMLRMKKNMAAWTS